MQSVSDMAEDFFVNYLNFNTHCFDVQIDSQQFHAIPVCLVQGGPQFQVSKASEVVFHYNSSKKEQNQTKAQWP